LVVAVMMVFLLSLASKALQLWLNTSVHGNILWCCV